MEKKTLYPTCMQHDIPQSLLVFAVSLTSETPNFGMFGGIAHPLEDFFNIIFKFLLYNCLYVHI